MGEYEWLAERARQEREREYQQACNELRWASMTTPQRARDVAGQTVAALFVAAAVLPLVFGVVYMLAVLFTPL